MKTQNTLSGKSWKKHLIRVGIILMLTLAMSLTVFAANEDFSAISSPIVQLLNSITGPALAIVIAVGTLYCIVLGVKFAKAEEPQEREKAKSHLKNAIIGFVLIFVLMLALNIVPKILANWANNYGSNIDTSAFTKPDVTATPKPQS